jgi:hypothetical protein
MTLNLWFTSGGNVYGPFSEKWAIAGGSLKGTVYYASYNTALNSLQNSGAVLSIRPSTPKAPALAIPSLNGQCHVCHEVSANGSTLFTNGTPPTYGEDDSASYNLASGDALFQTYENANQDKFTWSGVYPDGSFALANSNDNYHSFSQNSDLFDRDTQIAIPTTGFTTWITKAVTPIFSPDGLHIAFNFWSGTASNGVNPGNGQSLVAMDFDCGAAPGSITCSGTPPYAFSNLRQIYSAPASTDFVGEPTFSPDGHFVVFQHTTKVPPSSTCGRCGGTYAACSVDGSTGSDCEGPPGSNLDTFGQAYLQLADAQVTPTLANAPILCALNGMNPDCNTTPTPTSYLPAHTITGVGGVTFDDTQLNYEPNASPIASGGFTWVIFTTRRRYGNIATGNPFDGRMGTPAAPPITKKLWVAAIDLNPQPGTDPSHPAFYLPAQEINVGNMRGFMVADVCAPNGATCETGDECCGGFCRSDSTGVFTCTNKVTGCSNVYEHCAAAADCCGTSNQCVNNMCASKPGVVVQ